MSRKLNSNFVKDLVELYEDEGGITGQPFIITRRGTGPQTELRIKLGKSEHDFDVSGLEPWNLEEHAVRHIPYDQQEEFYFRGVDPAVRDRVMGRTPKVEASASVSEESSPFDTSDDDDEYEW